MLRWLYIQLLRAHPEEFRRRFADEMLEAFEFDREFSDRLRLLIDGVLSLGRQWVLRPEFRQPWRPASASGPVYELLTFQQIEPYKPSGVALAQGGLAAVLLLLGVVNAINHGGGKLRSIMIGMHRPGFGLIKLDRTAFEGQPLIAAEGARDQDDPLRPFARSYFRIVRVLSAIDSDGDLILSPEEMLNAPAALRRLDLNHDGKLSAEECGFLPPGDLAGPARLMARSRRDFMRENPVLAALDADRDGEISAAEIANSPAALKSLDLNNDGRLTPYELLPNPAVSQAAGMMGRFDTNDAGVIALQSLPKDDLDLESNRRLLIAADRNHDGIVTRGELIVELAVRSQAQWFRDHPQPTHGGQP